MESYREAGRKQRNVLHPGCVGCMSRWSPEGSARPFKARNVSWDILMYFRDKQRQTEKRLKALILGRVETV